MSVKGQTLRDLVVERLVVAADEIFALFERTFAEFEKEFVQKKSLQPPRPALHKDDVETPRLQPDQDDLLLDPPVVKSEADEAEASEQTSVGAEGPRGPEGPSCSVDRPFSCSDSDDEAWTLPKAAGDKDVGDFVDEDIPALYKSLFCPELDKTTKSEDSDLPKAFKCSVCGKTFETDELFEKHVSMHGVQSPFRCPVCHKLCSNKSSFKKHLNIHTEERPFSCPVCTKGFNQKCNLKRHMHTHSQDRAFSCPECGLRLKQQHNLLRHISAVHRGEKPYGCPVCDKSFAQKTVFIIHMRTHTGEKPFSCSVCKKRFRDKCHLKRHVKTHGDRGWDRDQGQDRDQAPESDPSTVHLHRAALFSPETKD